MKFTKAFLFVLTGIILSVGLSAQTDSIMLIDENNYIIYNYKLMSL
jgi:hypothetical protein